MTLTVFQDKKGMSLVEVMIALVILLLVFLALMQTATLGIESNMLNILREEAIKIGDERMSAHRNTPFTDAFLTDTNGVSNSPGCCFANDDVDPDTAGNQSVITRSFRNVDVAFTITRRIDDLSADNKNIEIRVSWDWKERNAVNLNPYTYTITTVMKRPSSL